MSERPTALEQPERYVSARELAELMGVSERTVSRWVAEHIPSETWGMTRTRRFLPSEAMAWARARRMSRPPGDDCNASGKPQSKE